LVCRRVGVDFSDCFPSAAPGRISVVIPTLNEEGQIEQTIRRALDGADVEVIVADGGSVDRTVEIARRRGAKVVPVRRGRGRQMNAGAAMASGEALLFLHADTRLPDSFAEHVWSTLDRGVVAGAFRLRIDGRGAGLRLVERGANLRSRLWQMPYGDQGFFIRAEDFLAVGGFKHWPLMEDYELCRRLKRIGRIGLASAPATTSGRRWQDLGVMKTTLVNQCCIAAFRLGVSPERVARYYYGRRMGG
jgi:hypothetical protein